MNILHLLSERSWRGGEQQAAYLIEACQQAGITCYVACRKDSALARYCHDKKITYFALPFRNQFDIYSAWQIKRICQRYLINGMHLHSANAHGLAILAQWLGCKIPLFLSRRVIFPIKKSFFSRYKYNHPAIKKIICVSHAVKDIITSNISDPTKCVTVYDGVELERFSFNNQHYLKQHYTIKQNHFIVGNIAALTADKGLFTFIDAAEYIVKKGIPVTFLIIGKGELQLALQEYINKKNLESQVILTGFLNNIPTILPELNVVVMTTIAEGLGSSLLDAIACDVPVVATKTGGIPEIIIDEQTGLLAPINDTEKIAAQIIRLLHDQPLKNKLVSQAKLHLLNNFTKDKMAATTINIYKNVFQHSYNDKL